LGYNDCLKLVGDKYHYRFKHKNQVVRRALDGRRDAQGNLRCYQVAQGRLPCMELRPR